MTGNKIKLFAHYLSGTSFDSSGRNQNIYSSYYKLIKNVLPFIFMICFVRSFCYNHLKL